MKSPRTIYEEIGDRKREAELASARSELAKAELDLHKAEEDLGRDLSVDDMEKAHAAVKAAELNVEAAVRKVVKLEERGFDPRRYIKPERLDECHAVRAEIALVNVYRAALEWGDSHGKLTESMHASSFDMVKALQKSEEALIRAARCLVNVADGKDA